MSRHQVGRILTAIVSTLRKLLQPVQLLSQARRKQRLWLGLVGVITTSLLLLGWSFWFSPAHASGRTYRVLSVPGNVIWGELFKPDSSPILRVKSGDRLVMTVGSLIFKRAWELFR